MSPRAVNLSAGSKPGSWSNCGGILLFRGHTLAVFAAFKDVTALTSDIISMGPWDIRLLENRPSERCGEQRSPICRCEWSGGSGEYSVRPSASAGLSPLRGAGFRGAGVSPAKTAVRTRQNSTLFYTFHDAHAATWLIKCQTEGGSDLTPNPKLSPLNSQPFCRRPAMHQAPPRKHRRRDFASLVLGRGALP